MINISIPVYHPDGEVAGCTIWRGRESPVWINVHIQQAREKYPKETLDNAIQALASDIFKMKQELEKKTTQTAFTGYD